MLTERYNRNIGIDYSAGRDFSRAYFYANKVYITIEEEDVRNKKKLITGEIRVRYKKRRKIELQLPFFENFNAYDNVEAPSYADFETIINFPFLKFYWDGNAPALEKYNEDILGHRTNFEPYIPPIMPYGLPIEVVLEEKKIEFLDGLPNYLLVNLTLIEKKNWYSP